MANNLVEKLTAEGGGESAGFLNELVAQLWPNICVAGGEIIKSTVEPMFKTMLPGPLASLHFTKIDFGNVPLKLSNVKTTRTDADGIKLDLNVDWEGKCDFELEAGMGIGLGVEKVHMHGRLSILLCPLTNVIPLIEAAQVAFINPPTLSLDFTGAANVADFDAIDGTVRKTILGVINSMLTLPNRLLVKLDAKSDYFLSYHYPLGTIRITVGKAWDFAEDVQKQSSMKKIFSKITRAEPDCFVEVTVGAEEAFRTSTKNNTTHPSWNETHDFVVSDYDQCIKLDMEDHDVNSNDEIGIAVTTVREILLAGGNMELPLIHKGEEQGGKVSVSAQYFKFAANSNSFSTSDHKGDGKICGVVTVLIAGAFDVQGQRKELQPSVVVTWGEKNRFQTAVKTDAPGTDINNPTFDQNFRIPVTTDMVGKKADNLRIALMNGEKEVGGADIPYTDVQNAPDMILQKKFDVGRGSTVRASICMRGIEVAAMDQTTLPDRSR